MNALLKKFETKEPEIIFEWNDAQTTAQTSLALETIAFFLPTLSSQILPAQITCYSLLPLTLTKNFFPPNLKELR